MSETKGNHSISGDEETNMDEDDNDFCQSVGSKRTLSMEDPDYIHPPNAKRMKEMQQRAHDELSERVIKVVDRELNYAMNEKQRELEEIDSQILRLQQCLSTLRYCVSLNYYTLDKAGCSAGKPKKQEIHPSVRRQLGKAPVRRHVESVTKNHPKKEDSNKTVAEFEQLSHCVPGSSKNLDDRISKLESGSQDATAGLSDAGVDSKSSESGEIVNDKDLNMSQAPCPKYVPPKPPDNPYTICQGGRHQKFQSKRRIVVGNTYQYLTPRAGGEEGDTLRYKWQVYVRAPSKEEDVSSFITAVTFILDQSYAPHHIITIKNPPFILSRRGWGEFKIQIALTFADTRNKVVKLLHPLVLSRADDPLALTGLWRLGQENWYDVWVYEPDSDVKPTTRNPDQIKPKREVEEEQEEQESHPASLTKELETGSVCSRVDHNVTVEHHIQSARSPVKTKSSKCTGDKLPEMNSDSGTMSKDQIAEQSVDSQQYSSSDSQCDANISNKINSIKNENGGERCKNQSTGKVVNVNGTQSKMCKIHVRQPDGRLLPYFIPAHMYSLALKIAQTNNTSQTSVKPKEAEGNNVDTKRISIKEIISQQPLQKEIVISHQQGQKPACEKQIKVDGEVITIKKEPDIIVTQQTEANKPVKVEIKTDTSDQDRNKTQTVPIRILNVSPNKVNTNQVVSSPKPSTSGIQGLPKLTLTSQGKHTVARVSSGNISQSALQQILQKAGVKDKKNVLVKQLLNKMALIKDANGEVMKPVQVQPSQVINAQTSSGNKSNVQYMPLKLVHEKQVKSSTAGKIIQRPISLANIRFVNSNGQLLSSGKGQKGMMLPSKTKQTINITPVSCAITTGAMSNLTTTVSSAGGNFLVVPRGRIITNSGDVQLVTSEGKSLVTQLTSLGVSSVSESIKKSQMPPLVVSGSRNSGILQAVSSSSTPSALIKNASGGSVSLLRGNIVTSVNSSSVRSLIKPMCITTTAGITVPTSVFTSISAKISESPARVSNLAHKIPNRENGKASSAKEEKLIDESSNTEEKSGLKRWTEQIRHLESICSGCNSADACVQLWVRALPLVAPVDEDRKSQPLPYCATSWEEFIRWPLGKQRALEFQRAREVKRRLEQCQVSGRENWPVLRIVAWARRHAYTPVSPRQLLRTDKYFSSENCFPERTLTSIGNLEKLSNTVEDQIPKCKASLEEIDVVFLDDGDDSRISSPLKQTGSPVKRCSEFVPWEEANVINGCEFVGHLTSGLRLNISNEEVLPGYTADAAKATIWKAMLSLMEDLLRESHSKAWERSESTSVPPAELTQDHVVEALTSSRTEFDLFTDYGLGSSLDIHKCD